MLNYVVKWINKRYGAAMKTHEKGYAFYKKFMRFIIRNHKLFGLLTIVFLLTHFFIQFNQFGLNTTGTVAAGVLVLQVLLGIYGSVNKQKGKIWLVAHRTIALILFLAIAAHLVLAF
jgi:heme A synthase